jgi:glyoxylase-like metal-dependent hydrolase (beta-lactamase superfamily II)
MVSHNLEFEAPYGQIEQLSPLVRRVVCDNPGVFTFKGTATFIVGNGAVAVIDPGPAFQPHVDAIVAGLSPGERVEAIVVTHTHPDHSLGARLLAEQTGAPTFGYGPHAYGADPTEDANDEPIDFSDHISAEDQKRFAAEWEAIPAEFKFEGYDVEFDPDERLLDGDDVSGPGWELRALHTPGHCSNHLCLALPAENTLFSGDHVMAWSTTVVSPPDGSMSDYLDSLRRVIAGGFGLLRPTHGGAVENPAEYVNELLDHRLERERQILAELRHGARRIVDIVPDIYRGYDKRLWYPAVGSVHAHLQSLVQQGLVISDPPGAGRSATFALA